MITPHILIGNLAVETIIVRLSSRGKTGQPGNGEIPIVLHKAQGNKHHVECINLAKSTLYICRSLKTNIFISKYFYRRVCTICEFGQNRQFYSLRGLCTDSRHDRKFTWERTPTSKPFLKGLSFSTITWVNILSLIINIV